MSGDLIGLCLYIIVRWFYIRFLGVVLTKLCLYIQKMFKSSSKDVQKMFKKCWLKTFVRSDAHHKIFFKLQRTGFSFVLNIFIDDFVPYSDYQQRLLCFEMLQISISKWHTKTHVFAWYVQEVWSVVGNVIHFFQKTSINNSQVYTWRGGRVV